MKRISENIFVVLVSMLIVAACASLPIQTTNDKLAAAYDLAQTLLQTDLELGQSGILSKKDVANVEAQIQNGKEALDIARSLYPSNTSSGDNKLASALTVLEGINTYLQAQQKVKP